MSQKIKNSFLNKLKSTKKSSDPQILEEFKFKTPKKNQLVAFFKPEAFLGKTLEQTEKILDLVFNKLDEHSVSIDGAALYPGQAVKKYSIMDRHYGVINTLSKKASKVLTKDERNLVFKALGIKNQNTKILGGHEAFKASGMGSALEFDNYWLSSPSTKIKSGFYVRLMKVGGQDLVVVNGFHPNQLEHYTAQGRFLGLMLISSNTAWSILRTEMLGETFPDKAQPTSIRGILYTNPKEYGFKKVGIDNNVVHLSAGPTEALFEMDNFLRGPFGVDFIQEEAKLAQELLSRGISKEKIIKILSSKELHDKLEHKDTEEAVEKIVSLN